MVNTNDRTAEPTDADLVGQAQEGSKDALDQLVLRHHGSVFRSVFAMLKDEDAAADATQDAFVKAMHALARFRGDSSFRTWVVAIAVNEVRGQMRKVKRRREEPLDSTFELVSGEQDALQRVTQGDEVRRIRTALEQLPEKQRLAVGLRIFEGMSFKEVGEAIHSTEGSARVNYHHGLKRLREMLA